MKICKHFHECGGCRFQDVSYREQLAAKQDKIKELASSYKIDTEIKPINPSVPEYNRNIMEFTFAPIENSLSGCAGREGVVCGLYSKKEKRKVVDIEEWLIFSPDLKKILKAVKEFVKIKKYPAYNKFTHQGFLRYLIVREAKFTKQIMIGIVTSSTGALDSEELIKVLISLKLKSTIKSV